MKINTNIYDKYPSICIYTYNETIDILTDIM